MRHLDPKRKGISRRLGVDTESLSYTRKRHRNDFLLIAIYLHSARVFRLCSPSFLVSIPARKPWHVSSLTTGKMFLLRVENSTKSRGRVENTNDVSSSRFLKKNWERSENWRKMYGEIIELRRKLILGIIITRFENSSICDQRRKYQLI